jgi:hypothetical protein
MTPENFSEKLLKNAAELKLFLQNKLPRYVGKTAVDFFQENFRQGGWRDGGLKKWLPPNVSPIPVRPMPVMAHCLAAKMSS